MSTVGGDRPGDVCEFCREGRIVFRDEEISFRQMTDKGYVRCRVTVPVGRCDRCGAGVVDEAAKPVMDDAVRRAYDALP